MSGEHLADRADAAVHHVARSDGVSAGLDVADRGTREQLERLVVGDLSVPDHAAVAVRRVLAEADVGDQDELRLLGTERPQRTLHDPVHIPGARPSSSFSSGTPNRSTALPPSRTSSPPRRRDPRPSSGSSRAAPRSARSRAPRSTASRNRRGRAVSRAPANAAHRCAATGEDAWREKRSRAQSTRRRGGSPLQGRTRCYPLVSKILVCREANGELRIFAFSCAAVILVPPFGRRNQSCPASSPRSAASITPTGHSPGSVQP